MTEARADWTDGERFVAVGSSGHSVVFDSDRQTNRAPGPMEMVLLALCACTATDVVTILRKKREAFTRVSVRAQAERAKASPMVFTSVKVIYTIGGKVTKKAVEDAVRLSEEKYCSVSAMVQKTARVTTEIEYAE